MNLVNILKVVDNHYNSSKSLMNVFHQIDLGIFSSFTRNESLILELISTLKSSSNFLHTSNKLEVILLHYQQDTLEILSSFGKSLAFECTNSLYCMSLFLVKLDEMQDNSRSILQYLDRLYEKYAKKLYHYFKISTAKDIFLSENFSSFDSLNQFVDLFEGSKKPRSADHFSTTKFEKFLLSEIQHHIQSRIEIFQTILEEISLKHFKIKVKFSELLTEFKSAVK